MTGFVIPRRPLADEESLFHTGPCRTGRLSTAFGMTDPVVSFRGEAEESRLLVFALVLRDKREIPHFVRDDTNEHSG